MRITIFHHKIIKFLFSALVIILVGASAAIYFTMRASLPTVRGKIKVDHLKAKVIVERDALGIPTINADNREDVAFALGFIHAQDRFFQMDLLRRSAAGELSELFGPKAVDADKAKRLHRFRFLSKQILKSLSPEKLAIIRAYTAGVNQGLNALSAWPVEYLLLLQGPSPWLLEDTLLVSYALFFELQDSNGDLDLARGYMKNTLPSDVYDFLINNGSKWDSTLDHTKLPILPIPDEKSFAYVSKGKHRISQEAIDHTDLGGSNSWVAAYDNKATLACDMHLRLTVPNIWYRASFIYKNERKSITKIYGATFPGIPFMIVGSNTKIAWGFTNAFVDTTDLIILENDEKDPNLYLTKEGPKSIEKTLERIYVKGQYPIDFVIESTLYGPIIDHLYFKKRLALQWIAHNKEALNLNLFALEEIESVESALKIAADVGVPVLNFMIADHKGHIGWTLLGKVPKRAGYDGTYPVSFNDGTKKWLGLKDFREYPFLYDSQEAYLWTANNRQMGGKWEDFFGKSGYRNGIRGFQIEQALSQNKEFTEKDHLAIQLDIKAIFFRRWQSLMLRELQKGQGNPQRDALKETVENWDGTCDKLSTGYYWTRAFRESVVKKTLGKLLAPCYAANPKFTYAGLDFEEPVWMIASEQPLYLKAPQFATWNEELLDIVDDIISKAPLQKIKTMTWGERNILNLQHPISKAISFLAPLFDMPKVQLSGDTYVPRVSGPSEGASQRLIVTPGQEENGIFHAPCGQSGHPLSPHYRDGESAWLEGLATPFLPSQPINRLILESK